jgi:DNA invertase Pin-like site-specific DNA recombinase
MGELLGYMRVSTKEQKFDLQRDALLAAGVAERNDGCKTLPAFHHRGPLAST